MQRIDGHPSVRARSLLPREHGTYGELAFPLLTALALARIDPASIALVVAFVTAFLAHEPMLLLFFRRGGRPSVELLRRARRRLVVLAGVGLVAFLFGLAAMHATARIFLLVPIALGALLALVVAARNERTALGEVFAAAALASCSLPIAIEGGLAVSRAFAFFAIWSVGFSLSTLAVRGVIATARGEGARERRQEVAFAASFAWVVTIVQAGLHRLPEIAPFALAPFALVSIALALFPPHARHLRTIGWLLIGASASTTAILIAAR